MQRDLLRIQLVRNLRYLSNDRKEADWKLALILKQLGEYLEQEEQNCNDGK